MSPLVAAAADAALLPVSVMHAGPVRVLAAFVTINTVMYCVLAAAKILPRLHPSTWLPRSYRRGQERSIHPPGWLDDGTGDGTGYTPGVVMEVLRHPQSTITTDPYGRVTPTAVRPAASAIDDVLGS